MKSPVFKSSGASILPQKSNPVHWIAMSGEKGCLPDHCEVFATRKSAIDDLTNLFELGSTRRKRLARDGYLELVLSPIEKLQDVVFGAEYCEVQPCACSNPAVHSDGAGDFSDN